MSNSLASVHPELISEWSEKNLPLTPDKITFGSNKRVWWKGACGHEWETSVKARSKGEKCPICSGARVIEGINDLATLKPLLAQEWSEKNELKPTEVSVASHMSIAAGYGIAAIREGIGRDAGIIRIMPNVNANVCASTTGYATSASITAAQLDAFHFAFGKIGELIELDESEFETFSAIAGCGVAYVYMFIDAMARAGVKNGLSKQKALSIAASAVMGSAKLVSESGMHPYALIDSVTTPGGTTIEGVLTLQRCGFESAVHAAIQASIDKELGMK